MRRAFLAILQRDLKIAFRRVSELANPLLFFLIVASLFPLAVSPDEEHLRSIGSGVLWVVALLSSLLALEGLFRADAEDGSLEQLMLSPVPLGVAVLAKVAAHWLVTIVPLVVLTPLLALSFYLPVAVLPVMAFALLLATPTLSVLVALGAAKRAALDGRVENLFSELTRKRDLLFGKRPPVEQPVVHIGKNLTAFAPMLDRPFYEEVIKRLWSKQTGDSWKQE